MVETCLVRLLLKYEIPILRDEAIRRFLGTIQDEDVTVSIGKFVVKLGHAPLLPGVIARFPNLIDFETAIFWISVWQKSNFLPGLAALLPWTTDVGWVAKVDVESADEEVKIALGMSEQVRSEFPDLHALLILDESPQVRFAGAVDGLNPIQSFRKVVGRCSVKMLQKLTAEPSRMSERYSDFCLRAEPRRIARMHLNAV